MSRFKCYNGAMPTTAALVKVATGTAIKTMLQIATPSGNQITPISWGFSLDAPPTATGRVELIQTDAAATGLTAHVAAGVFPLDPNAPGSAMTLGTGATGYATGVAPTEGATAVTRLLDQKEIPIGASATGTSGTDCEYSYQFTAAERWTIAVSKFLRVRATFGGSVNMICWVLWDE